MTTLLDCFEQGRALPHGVLPTRPRVKGKRWKIPVQVLVNDSRECTTLLKVEFLLVARSAREAVDWVWERMRYLPEVEIRAWGPRGGECYRFVSWEDAVGSGLLFPRSEEEQWAGFVEVLGEGVTREHVHNWLV